MPIMQSKSLKLNLRRTQSRRQALAAGAFDAVATSHFADGGLGAVPLAEAVVRATERPANFKFLYELDMPIVDKIETIVREVCTSPNFSHLCFCGDICMCNERTYLNFCLCFCRDMCVRNEHRYLN